MVVAIAAVWMAAPAFDVTILIQAPQNDSSNTM